MKNFKISESLQYGIKATIANFWVLFSVLVLLFGVGWVNTIFNGLDLYWVYVTLLTLLSVFLSAFLLRVILNIFDNKKNKFEEVAEIFPKLFRFILASIIYQGIVLIGLILFIVPGIIMIVKFQFTPYLIIDKDLELGEAFRKSNELASGVQWKLFWFMIVGIAVSLSGFIVFGIGALFSIPTVWMAGVFVYRSLLNQSKIK